MSTQPLTGQPEQLPTEAALAEPSSRHSGSVGPFFAVLSVIVVLIALSCLFGRIAAKREDRLSLDGPYGCWEWMKKRYIFCCGWKVRCGGGNEGQVC